MNDSFVLIEASTLTLSDWFMQHHPNTEAERKLKEELTDVIKEGINDFYHSRYDPSFSDVGNGICFDAGRYPAVNRSYEWWDKTSREFWPERGSRLGTRREYVAFLGLLIKKFDADGMRLSDAWGRVCNNSASLGHYWNSDWHKEEFELTGSRDVCGFCDLANTYKLLAVDPVRRGYFVASGYYNNLSNIYPIANKVLLCSRDTVFGYGVGWVILER